MAKVTAINAEGQNVPVHQAQFNNRGEVESFLTSTPAGHQVWVHARDYTVTVDDAADQPDLTPGIMTKDTTLKPSDTIDKELVPPADPAEPAVPSEPVVPPVSPPAEPVPPVEPPAAVPPVEPPVAPTTAPELPPADEPINIDPAQDSGIISEGDLPPTPTSNPRPPRPNVS